MQTSATTYRHSSPTLFYGGGFCGGVDPRREQYAGEDVAGVEVPDYKTKYEALQNVIKDNYQLFEVDYYSIDNDNYVDGEGFCCEPKAQAKNARSLPTENVDYEKLQYYYHPDHLGSASYITNLDGEVVQHIEYVPFGEVFIEERNNTWNTPFLFNGKELDEETGLYYYGARYYNPRISLWYGVDPLFDKYPAHSPYCYTMNNPVMLIDPDGKDPIGAITDAIMAFAVDAGMQFVTNVVFEDMEVEDAFNNINWRSAGIEAGKSYAVSLIFTGVGTARAFGRALNSKAGRIGVEFAANLGAEILKKYKNGEFNDDNGNFSMDKMKNEVKAADVIKALIAALVSQGFTKKADKLQAKLDKSRSEMDKHADRLYDNLRKNSPEKAIANRMKNVNRTQKKYVTDLGKVAAHSTVSKATTEGVSDGAKRITEEVME